MSLTVHITHHVPRPLPFSIVPALHSSASSFTLGLLPSIMITVSSPPIVLARLDSNSVDFFFISVIVLLLVLAM
jgi:hypothetical protein